MSGTTGRKEIRIAVMGATGSGKTSFINRASGSSLTVGRGLESCTSEVQTSKPFMLNGRVVTLVDTPGFDDTTRSDTDILKLIAAYFQNTYEHGTKLAGIIYLHRISDIRMGGTSSRNFRMFRELCGEKTLKNVVVLTNMWNEVSPEVGAAREHELADKDKFFKPVIDKGARMLRHTDTKESAHAVLRYLVNMQPATLQIQDELVNQHKEIGQTAAGSELSHELKEQADKHERELQALREEMLAALRAKDDEAKEELRAEMLRKQAEIERVQRESMHLVESYRTQKEKLDAQIHEMEEKHRKQVEALDSINSEMERVNSEMENAKREHARTQSEEMEARRLERQRHMSFQRKATMRESELQELVARAKEEAARAELEVKEQQRREQEELQAKFEKEAASLKAEREAHIAAHTRQRTMLEGEMDRIMKELEEERQQREREAAAARVAASHEQTRKLEEERLKKTKEEEERQRKAEEEARARQATEAEKKRREAEEEEKRRQKQKEEQEREIERARLQAEHERALRDMQLKLEKATRQAEEERKAREAKETREAYDRALEEERRKHSLSFDSIPYILVSGFLGWLRR